MNLKRRSFLSVIAAALGASAVTKTAQAQLHTPVPEKWNETVDVLVIGAGGAGFSAAVTAKEEGAKSVLLAEKLPFVGGNTMLCSGLINAVDPERQNKLGIKDSKELHLKQTLDAGDNRANPELVKILTDNALDSVHWLEAHGMKFKDEVYQAYGALYPRTHVPVEAKGQGYIKAMVEAAKKVGVNVQTNLKLISFIREKPLEGRVLGALFENAKKEKVYIRAKAVVLATGGFAANREMRSKHDPRMYSLTTTNNAAASTGEGLLAAKDIGAYLIGMDYIQCNPGTPPGKKYRGVLHLDVSRYIFVGPDAKRFVAEDERRDVLRDAILNLPEKFGYTVVDNDGFLHNDAVVQETTKKMVKEGEAWTADSIEELAKKMGLNPTALKKTVDEYNSYVDSKKDPIGKNERNLNHKIIKPPFWACYSAMSVHHTMGGVQINTKTQVLDDKGNVIPGLYAAGEVTGGIHGTNRVGANAVADIFTFGRIAGKNAAAESKK